LRKNIKVLIQGSDNVGWSVDQDRINLIDILKTIDGIELTTNYYKADIIHNVWWNTSFGKLNTLKRILFKRKILLTASNFIDLENSKYHNINLFNEANKFSYAWISPSLKQHRILIRNNFKSYYLPFIVSNKKFYKISKKKKEIFKDLGLNPSIFKNKIIISSFQRDTLADLKTPKWQKNPLGIINILNKLPKNSSILLICGPRRHFIRKKCNDYNIPYFFYGKETENDDLQLNNLDEETVNKLYNISDIYLNTSKSEGGPKSIIESILTSTIIFSTDVGIASDFLEERFLLTHENLNNDLIKKIVESKVNTQFLNDTRLNNLRKYDLIYSKYQKLVKDIYFDVLDEI
jgi:hypothetical protein